MDNRTTINDLLAQVGAIAKLLLSLNSDGVCNLSYQELDLAISVPEESDQVQFFAFLLPIPDQGKKELFEKLLQGNLLRQETRGAFFALSQAEEQLVLVATSLIEGLTFEKFERQLVDFIESALYWKSELVKGDKKEIKQKDGLLENLKYRI